MGDIKANEPLCVEEAALLLEGLREASRDDENNKGSALESGALSVPRYHSTHGYSGHQERRLFHGV